MIYQRDDLHTAYQQIKKDAEDTGGQTVLVLTAVDCDSLCACRMLKAILHADFIQYSLQPVIGYESLKAALQRQLDNNDDLRSVVLINCGSNIDIQEFLEVGEQDDIALYVIDSHRPVHLANAFAPDTVWIFDDGRSRKDVLDIQDVYFGYVAYRKDGEGDSGDESDSDTDSESSTGSDGGNDDKAGADESGSDGEPPRKRPKKDIRKEAWKEARRRIREYYRSSFRGMSVSMYVWSLAVSLSRDSADLLWNAIVGVTDGYICEHTRQEEYDMLVAELQGDVLRLGGSGDDEEHLLEDGTTAARLNDGSIHFEEECRLTLLRHWTLYDSLYHSPYVATRLGIWKEQGRRKLELMLAKMGIPLEQCRQQFQWMGPEFKQSLRPHFAAIKGEYGLHDVLFGSFYRESAFQPQVSAADVVHAVNALLVDGPEGDGKGGQSSAEVWERNFDRALDAMDDATGKAVQGGIAKAKSLHQVLVKEGVSLMEKHAIASAGTFAYAYITQSPHQSVLVNAPVLTQLALFLVDAILGSAINQRKPFVLCALDEDGDPRTYTVVGVMGSMRHRDVQKNHFGLVFRKVAERTGARVRHDGFGTAVIQVLDSDIHSFMEYLHLELGG